jgi:tripartite-type tricarboxylate transporter receptor subunit TctC
MPTRQRLLIWGLVLCAVILGGNPVTAAEAYPGKPIKMVVPFPPGGGNDALARLVAKFLGESLGQQVIVDNRGGAGGIVGTQAVAKAIPDGYTLLLGYTGTLAINPHLYQNIPYDAVKDFAPVAVIASTPLVLVGHPALPARNVAELIALAKAKPNSINFASSGSGTGGHLVGESFKVAAGIEITHIPYKGTGPAIVDLLGGQVEMMFSVIPAALQHIQTGGLRALAVTSLTRSSTMPDVPTVAEAGLPGFETVLRYGVLAPAGTPEPIVNRLSQDIRVIMQRGEIKERLLAEGAETLSSTPEEYAAIIGAELTKWGPVVKSSGARVD